MKLFTYYVNYLFKFNCCLLTEAFSNFKQDDQFFCFFGQTKQTVTGMYNLYRASQVLFPGESILEEARVYTKKFLKEKRAEKQLRDKWIIAKGLEEEVMN